MTTVYEELKAAGLEIHNHYSDLYVVVCPVSKEIVDRYKARGHQVEMFMDRTTRQLTYDLFGAYDPYWTSYWENTSVLQ